MKKFIALIFAFVFACCIHAGEDLKHGPDSEIHEGVPRGKVEQQPKWKSTLFPGTERDWWIYVPAQYDPKTPANVMVFQDGGGPKDEKGEMRAPVVFDNLINKKEMPVTIGIFINPGYVPSTDMSQIEVEVTAKDGTVKKEKRAARQARQNRAFEYDAVGDRYARFLIEEILPEVAKKYTLTTDPAGRAICGQSSGGSCAFTAAWERPDVFGKVVSGIGSFTSLHGCNVYPDLIRKTEPKPIRVFLQDGSADLDIYAGSWWHANQDMAAALRWSGYDYKFLEGTGGHSGKQLGVNFPEVMRWLWRNDPVQGKRPGGVDPRGVFEVLIKDEGWKKVADCEKGSEADVDDAGNVYFDSYSFADKTSKTWKLTPGEKPVEFAKYGTIVSDIKFGPDGRLFGVVQGNKIVAVDAKGAVSEFAHLEKDDHIGCMAINSKGDMFCFVNGQQKVVRINAKMEKTELKVAESDTTYVNFTPDQGFLIAGNYESWGIQSFRAETDGSLAHPEIFYTLQSMEGQERSKAYSSATDDRGRLYISSINGIQIFDQGGRVIGILTLPERNMVFGLCFGGPNFDTLYAVTESAVYARKLNAKGVRSCKPPVAVRAPQM